MKHPDFEWPQRERKSYCQNTLIISVSLFDSYFKTGKRQHLYQHCLLPCWCWLNLLCKPSQTCHLYSKETYTACVSLPAVLNSCPTCDVPVGFLCLLESKRHHAASWEWLCVSAGHITACLQSIFSHSQTAKVTFNIERLLAQSNEQQRYWNSRRQKLHSLSF